MDQVNPLSATENPLVDFDAVCQKVRAAMESARVYAVSLHDEKGDVLWLTESSMGPDEHNAVREAFDAFSNSAGPTLVDHDLGDSRSAVLFRAVNSRRVLVGAIMVIVDTRVITQDGKGAARLMTPKFQRALTEFAGMRQLEPAPPAPPATRPTATPVSQAAAAASSRAPPPGAAKTPLRASGEATTTPSRASAPPEAATPPVPTGPVFPPMEVIELSLADSIPNPRTVPPPQADPAPPAAGPGKRPAPPVSPEIDRLHAALRRSPIALHVQRLVPLNKGSQLKRYEVLLRSQSEDAPNVAPHAMLKAAVENGLGSMIDRRVVTQLIGWLIRHPDVWKAQAVLFSVNLTSTALHDEHFIKFVDLCLAKASLPKAMIAFEIDVTTALSLGDKVAEVAAALHRLHCPLVLDDFGLRTECFDLLRLPAVRYIKLATEMTAKMRSDKISQAAITAVVQMARVLGMHTVAKRTETAAEQEWLTALGVDFIQSNALSPPIAIDSLSKMPKG